MRTFSIQVWALGNDYRETHTRLFSSFGFGFCSIFFYYIKFSVNCAVLWKKLWGYDIFNSTYERKIPF